MKPSGPRAWVISIGTELLVGRIVNTNAAWISRRLTFMGFNVERIIVVPDSLGDIIEEVRRGVGRAKLIVTTGGLGPTYDDVTMEAIARALGRELVVNVEAESMVRDFYSRRGLPLTPERLKMAYMSEGCRALRNPIGSAPGCIIEYNGTLIAILPGVPEEMEAMFETGVVGVISRLVPSISFAECHLLVKGVPESSLAPKLRELAERFPDVYLKSHPRGYELGKPVVELRALASASTREEALRNAKQILEHMASYISNTGGETGEISCT